jgi:sulfatase modifying factor 1
MMADDAKGIRTDKSPSKFTPGKNHLLVIAIDDYLHCRPRLHNCVNDAGDLVKLLTNQYLFNLDHTTKLLNDDATRANILSRLRALKDLVQPTDNLVIYFSGHGVTVDDVGYWIPVEAHPDHDHEFVSTYDLKSRLDAINSFHTFVIADACFSGSLFITFKDLLAAGYETKRSRWGLAASHSRERALDGTPGENSPFAASLLKNLRENRDNLGIHKLAAAVIEEVEAVTKKKQTPVFKPLDVKGDDSGQFVFRIRSDENSAWQAALEMDSVQGFLQFSERYPTSTFVEDAIWKIAGLKNTVPAIDDYPGRFPSGLYAEQALAQLKKLEEEENWQDAIRLDTLSSYREYLHKYPQGQHHEHARKRIDELRLRERGTSTPMIEVSGETIPAKHTLSTPPQDMVLIRGGTFEMGDVMMDEEYNDETVHRVTVSDFYIGIYAVTFDEYDPFCKATNRLLPNDSGWGRGKRPVINIDWYDAIEYCNWLSNQKGLEEVYSINKDLKDPQNSYSEDTKRWLVKMNRFALGFRLPTEAEWEYAARQGGGKVRFGNGKDIADPKEINFDETCEKIKNYSKEGKNRNKTTEVGACQPPNSLGLYDMSGNVWEWCWDWYDDLYYQNSHNSKDPEGPPSGSERLTKGGSWQNDPRVTRNAYRRNSTPDTKKNYFGFRLATSTLNNL